MALCFSVSQCSVIFFGNDVNCNQDNDKPFNVIFHGSKIFLLLLYHLVDLFEYKQNDKDEEYDSIVGEATKVFDGENDTIAF